MREATADPEWAAVVDAWPRLPSAIRARVLAIIGAAVKESEGFEKRSQCF